MALTLSYAALGDSLSTFCMTLLTHATRCVSLIDLEPMCMSSGDSTGQNVGAE